MRKIHQNIPVLFRPEKWTVTEDKYSIDSHKNNETIFYIANGYLGVRGFFEEGIDADSHYSDPTTMINGIYEYHKYNHIWQRPGFPGRYHSITPQVNGFDVQVFIDNEKCVCREGAIDYLRILDMRDGSVVRQFVFETSTGKSAKLILERLASQTNLHLLFNKITVITNDDCNVEIMTTLKPLSSFGKSQKEEIGSDSSTMFELKDCKKTEDCAYINYKTVISGFEICCAISEKTNMLSSSSNEKNCGVVTVYKAEAKAGDIYTVERAIAYYTNNDGDNYVNLAIKDAVNAVKGGYEQALKDNSIFYKEFWENSDIEIVGDDLILQGVRYSLFTLHQSAGKDGKTNISANGLTGTGYSGHTFWDTEIFMMPFFLYTNPELAKKLLMYRYNILPNALKRAKEMDDIGALFAWNSINGEECGHVFEAATAQYHINCDIFYAIMKYYEATEDFDFMAKYGIEMLLQMSKCLAYRGNFIALKDNKFCINCICGPDEYNPVVDNNLYTNWLARKQFYYTLEMLEKLKAFDSEAYNDLIAKTEISDKDLRRIKDAADNMYIPYHKELDIYMLDDNFLYKDPIDIEAIPLNKLPLLTNLHPLNLWRYQVCKQADIVLLMFLCSNEFSLEMKKKIYDFYEPKTIHDSSLSAGVHSIVAMDIGYNNEAYGYLKQAARMDLDNVNRNTFFGVHSACMGSTYMMIVNGFAGMRIYEEAIHLKPSIPEHWESFSFKVRIKSSLICFDISKNKISIEVKGGDAPDIFINGNKGRYIAGTKTTVALLC